MRRLFGFLFQLIALALLVVALTVIWMIFDGLNDVGDKADVALISGPDELMESSGVQPRLDRAAKLYKDGEFPAIIVAGAVAQSTYDEPAAMRKYLEDHGVPSDAIIQVTHAENTWDMASEVAQIMRAHGFYSVMLVTDYYHMTRLKLALNHAGIYLIQKTHVGTVRKEDAFSVGREVIALYDYIGKTFLLPAAEKIKAEASVEADKAKIEAQQTKDQVDKSLDKLPK